MSEISMRELNSNVSWVFARVEADETLLVTKNGKIIAKIVPESPARTDTSEWRSARERLRQLTRKGIMTEIGRAHV